MAGIFRQTVAKHPQKTAFIFEQKRWTFQDVEDYSNKIANYFKSQGYKKGDTLALLLDSCPEYVCIWLGLSKLGVITALINTNLRLNSLRHCISEVDAKAIIFGSDLSGNLFANMISRKQSDFNSTYIHTYIHTYTFIALPEKGFSAAIFKYILKILHELKIEKI